MNLKSILRQFNTRSRWQRRALLAVVPVFVVASIINTFMMQQVQAAVSFVAAASADNISGNWGILIDTPSGTQNNHVMVAVVSVRGGSGTTITPPSGWTQINVAHSGTTLRSVAYYKVADNEGADHTFVFSSSQRASAVIASYAGVDPASPIDVHDVQVNSSSSTFTAPSVTTTVDDSRLVGMYSVARSGVISAGSGMIMRGQAASGGGGFGDRTATALQDGVQVTAGATGDKTASASNAAISIGHLIALKPALDPVLTQEAYRWYENNATLTEGDFTQITDADALPGNNIMTTAWSPDGRYLSVGSWTSAINRFTIFKRTGDRFNKLPDPSTMPGSAVITTAWSPDGQYLSVGSATSDATRFTIYKRSGDSFVKLDDPSTMPGNTVTSTAWSPDGQYLSVGSATSDASRLTIYKRSGDVFTKLPNPSTMPGDTIITTAWSPDGQYLSVGSATSDATRFTIYKRSGDSFVKLDDPSTMPGNTVTSTAWSPDGQYLSVGSATSDASRLTIYKRSGDVFTKLPNPSTMPGNNVTTVDWFLNGLYLSVGSDTTSADRLTIYRRSGDSFVKLDDPSVMPGNNVSTTAWSPDGRYLSVGSDILSINRLTVYKFDLKTQVGDPLAAIDTEATAPVAGTPFRLQLNLGVATGPLSQGEFKLRYYHTPSGTCNASAAYSDVTTSSQIKYFSNTTLAHGLVLAAGPNGPARGGVTPIYQTYNEQNPFTVDSAVAVGEDGIWDFALTLDESAPTYGAYCLKATDGDNGDLGGGYDVLPRIVPTSPPLENRMRHGQSVINGLKTPLNWQ